MGTIAGCKTLIASSKTQVNVFFSLFYFKKIDCLIFAILIFNANDGIKDHRTYFIRENECKNFLYEILNKSDDGGTGGKMNNEINFLLQSLLF